MKKANDKIDGLLVYKTKEFFDNRGSLRKVYSTDFDALSQSNEIYKEIWFTKSKLDVLRGMHLQVGERKCKKIISVIKGSILDVVIDLRPTSSTFLSIFSQELSDQNNIAILIPTGCAHGYRVLQDQTITMYMASDVHDSLNDVGIKWDSFGFDWELEKPIISERDNNLPNLNDLDLKSIIW